MSLYYTAESRDYEFVRGSGSKIEIAQYNADRSLTDGWTTLDIEQGIIRETFVNQITTHSGGVGGTGRTRVGFDWTAALVLNFPALAFPGPLRVAFIQELLGSWRGVAVRFYMGAPEFWEQISDGGEFIRTMRADRALLGPIETRVDAGTPPKVIGLSITLESSSMLRHELHTGTLSPTKV